MSYSITARTKGLDVKIKVSGLTEKIAKSIIDKSCDDWDWWELEQTEVDADGIGSSAKIDYTPERCR